MFIFGAAFFDFIFVNVTRHVSPAIGCFSLLFFLLFAFSVVTKYCKWNSKFRNFGILC